MPYSKGGFNAADNELCSTRIVDLPVNQAYQDRCQVRTLTRANEELRRDKVRLEMECAHLTVVLQRLRKKARGRSQQRRR